MDLELHANMSRFNKYEDERMQVNIIKAKKDDINILEKENDLPDICSGDKYEKYLLFLFDWTS